MTQSSAEDYGRRAEEARAKVEYMIGDEARLSMKRSPTATTCSPPTLGSATHRSSVVGKSLGYNGRRALNYGLCARPLGVGP